MNKILLILITILIGASVITSIGVFSLACTSISIALFGLLCYSDYRKRIAFEREMQNMHLIRLQRSLVDEDFAIRSVLANLAKGGRFKPEKVNWKRDGF